MITQSAFESMKNIFILFALLIAGTSYGQTYTVAVTGPTTATIGQTRNYATQWTDDSFNISTEPPAEGDAYWTSSATVLSSTSSSYSVQFATTGTKTIQYEYYTWDNYYAANYNVTVSSGTPAAPVSTYTQEWNCGNTNVTRQANPPAGVEWYWQTSSAGTSTSLGNGATINVTTNDAIYLRARLATSPFTWSSAASNSFSPTVVNPLAAPSTSTNGDVITATSGAVTVSVSAVSGAAGYAWYTVASGGTAISGVTGTSYTPTLSATTTYYVASLNNNCPSTTRKSVVANVHPVPVISGGLNVNMGTPVTLSVSNYSYATYQWKRDGSNISGATSSTYTTNVAGTYSINVTKGSASGTSVTNASVTIGPIGQDLNLIVSHTPQDTGITTLSQVNLLPASKNIQTVQHFDGLGRLMQTVNSKASPDANKDLVQSVAYDGYGREVIKYLPYAVASNDGTAGLFKAGFRTKDAPDYTTNPQYTFYQTTPNVAVDSKPYAVTVAEPSPFNRLLEQGAPGLAWQPDATNSYTSTDHTVKNDYAINTTGEVLLWTYTYPVGDTLGFVTTTAASHYPAGSLYKTKTKDEDGHEVIEYKDKQGRVVLKRVQAGTSQTINDTNYASTYYIYDDFGSLVAVVPPEATSRLAAEFFSASYPNKKAFLEAWAFRYAYDGNKRMTIKQVPGAKPVYMVYDLRDRLVLTQDGNQRAANQWLYTKYDALNRPVMTGIYTHGSSIGQSAMSALISTTNFYETYNDTSATHGYTNMVFPTTNLTLLTATYYDDYSFKSLTTGLNYVNNDLTGQITTEFLRVRGLATGAKVNITGTSNYLYSVNYYDKFYRVIQSIAQNHKSGTDRVTNKYDFTGKVLETLRTYVVSGVTRTVKETVTYDHAGRVLNVKHNTNGAGDVMLVKNSYNELGQLIDKQLHSTDNGATFKQSVDYRYNIRGWLTKINEADIYTLGNGETLPDYFGMELGYESAVAGITATSAYNGNISAMKWSTGTVGASNLQGNAYSYDAMNRLLANAHYKDEFTGWKKNNSFVERSFVYDLNGNIQKLTRRGDQASLMDSLAYTYAGNQLQYVHDLGDAALGFVNGNTGTDDYAYDYNGNLIRDKNKGIANSNDIKYNHLNLPTEVIKGSDKVKYYYDATGRKLYQELYTGASLTKTTDYVGELVLENGTLQFINHAEGRVVPDGANWEYQYHLKDHLGNVRITFTVKAQTPTSTTATFETGTQTAEQAAFSNYSSITYDLVDHTDAGTTYQKVQYLNGGASGRVGLAKSYAVMPGDKIKAEVYAKYRNLSGTANATSFITALASAFGTSSGATGELGKLYSGLNSYATVVAGGDHPSDDESAPKAFVTILLFDKNYNLVDAAWDQIDVAANQTSGTVKTPPNHDYMTKEVTVAEAGYAYVFLSNEHPTYVDVYFDDLTITHTPGQVIAVNDYYPFGLTFNSYSRENTTSQDYKFNGKELQDELSLGWLDYGARMYMPEIGRWGAVDPLVEKFYPASPYNYAFSNPVNLTDPDGRSAEAVIDEKNKTITVNMVYVFYGSGANDENMKAAIATLNSMWNANAGEDGWSDAGDGWKIQVNATGVVTDEEGAQEMADDNEGNALFNYVRVEEQNNAEGVMDPTTGETDHKVSQQTGNSGFWVTRDMKDTTPAHESGHGLNLSTPWHDNADGIMVPGTNNRKVTPSNLNELKNNVLQGQDKSSLIDKYLFNVKRVNVGSTSTTIYDKDGRAKN